MLLSLPQSSKVSEFLDRLISDPLSGFGGTGRLVLGRLLSQVVLRTGRGSSYLCPYTTNVIDPEQYVEMKYTRWIENPEMTVIRNRSNHRRFSAEFFATPRTTPQFRKKIQSFKKFHLFLKKSFFIVSKWFISSKLNTFSCRDIMPSDIIRRDKWFGRAR